jgi:hypothetical protein
MIRFSKARALALMVAVLALPGCGGIDGVEFNGGVFNALGLGSGSGAEKDPVVPQRAGLVLPPQKEVLPQPGSGADPAAIAANGAWPQDPEERKRQQVAANRQAHDQFCQKELQRKKAMGDESPTNGPMGRCDPSILNWFGSTGEVKEMRGSSQTTQR